MNIALIGATGFVGSAILQEALERGHAVTALVRDPGALNPHPKLRTEKADVYDAAAVARLVTGHDALISAFNPGWRNPDLYKLQLNGTNAIIQGVKLAGLKRLLFVGGSGSLEVKPGVQGVDLPSFPEEYKQGALALRDALNILRQETNLEWTVLSPSADLFSGERTGRFRLGTDQLLRDTTGESRISVEDLAMAMINEVEHPQHIRRRFTVGY